MVEHTSHMLGIVAWEAVNGISTSQWKVTDVLVIAGMKITSARPEINVLARVIKASTFQAMEINVSDGVVRTVTTNSIRKIVISALDIVGMDLTFQHH